MDKHIWLGKAVAEGIISEDQSSRMLLLLDGGQSDSEERTKSVINFNELFVSIGTVFLITAIAGLLRTQETNLQAGMILQGIIVVGIAELFHRKGRFALPVLVSMLIAAASFAAAVMYIQNGQTIDLLSKHATAMQALPPLVIAMVTLACAAWRYTIPFLMCPISILFAMIITMAARGGDGADVSYQLLLGGAGLGILAFAVHCDLRDPQRVHKLSDFAFWSYVVGSPLFVHSLFLGILMQGKASWVMGHSVLLILLPLVLAVSFAGLLINRRALVLSTMIYAGFIVYRVLDMMQIGSLVTVPLIALCIIGLYIISLGSHWRRVRNYLLDTLPPWKWLEKLPVR